MKYLPPIATLRALEAAARHLSFTKAAEELHVTQSAISHQIAYLEQSWGIELFERVPRGVALTREGGTLAAVVRGFLEQLQSTLNSFVDGEPDQALRVSTTQSFALAWLLPLLPRFKELDHGFDIWLSTTNDLVDLQSEELDAAIRLGDGNYPDLHVTFLLREYVFPVCSPDLIARRNAPAQPRDLLDLPLLFRKPRKNTPDWEIWFRKLQVQGAIPTQGPHFQDSFMAIQAAVAGQGVALARSAHVVELIRSGQLVKLCDPSMPSPLAYFFVTRKGRENEPRIVLFREWLTKETALSQIEFERQATQKGAGFS